MFQNQQGSRVNRFLGVKRPLQKLEFCPRIQKTAHIPANYTEGQSLDELHNEYKTINLEFFSP